MLPNLKEKEIVSRSYGSHSKIYVSVTPFCVLVCVPPLKNASDIIFKVKVPLFATAVDLGPHCYIWAWVLSKHHLNIASLRIGKHRIIKNIAPLRKVNIAQPYPRVAEVGWLSENAKKAINSFVGRVFANLRQKSVFCANYQNHKNNSFAWIWTKVSCLESSDRNFLANAVCATSATQPPPPQKKEKKKKWKEDTHRDRFTLPSFSILSLRIPILIYPIPITITTIIIIIIYTTIISGPAPSLARMLHYWKSSSFLH